MMAYTIKRFGDRGLHIILRKRDGFNEEDEVDVHQIDSSVDTRAPKHKVLGDDEITLLLNTCDDFCAGKCMKHGMEVKCNGNKRKCIDRNHS